LKFLTKKNTFSFYVFFFNVIVVSITLRQLKPEMAPLTRFSKIHKLKLVKRFTAFLFFRN